MTVEPKNNDRQYGHRARLNRFPRAESPSSSPHFGVEEAAIAAINSSSSEASGPTSDQQG